MDEGVRGGGPAAPTLDSVARLAGVSRQTVSNALHRPDRLRPHTRDKVLAAVAELDYRPSLPARQLAMRRSMTVAVPAHRPQPDGVSGMVLDAFLHGLAEVSHPTGHRVLLYPAAADDGAEVPLLEDLLLSASVDAVVLTATRAGDRRAAWLTGRHVPFCSFGRTWGQVPAAEGTEAHDWVDVDGADGCEQAVDHLVARGSRRIAFVGWPEGSQVGDDRRTGYERGVTRTGSGAGLPPAAAEDETGAARAAVAALLAGHGEVDGLVCASDTLALGAWQACREAGLGARIVGFDATPVTAALGLASVAQPVAEAARACIDLVLPRIRDGSTPPARGVLLRPTLVDPTLADRAAA